MEEVAPAQGLSLESMKSASSLQVKNWLRNALAASGATGTPAAFAPFQNCIKRGDTLVADLHLIYSSIPPQNQGAWRAAIADLVAEMPAEQSNAQSLRVLIDLARRIPAYEVFERAGWRLASRNFAQLSLPNGDTLYRRCLKMAIELSTGTDMMKDILVSLVQSEFFPRTLALQTLAALGRSAPSLWTKHLKMLRPRISDLLQNDPPSAGGVRRQARALLDGVGLKQAVAGLASLRRAPDDAFSCRFAYDDWLINELFLGPDPFIKLVISRPDAIFYLASDRDICEVVDATFLDKSIVGGDIRADVAGDEGDCGPDEVGSADWIEREGQLGDIQRQLDDGLKRIGIDVERVTALEPDVLEMDLAW